MSQRERRLVPDGRVGRPWIWHDGGVETDGVESSVCVGCGLCCDGTVLSHLAVADDSDLGLPLVALGAEVLVVADPPVFALPCPAVDHGVCTIYELHRPHACSQFECDLSRDVASGARTRAEADAVIARARALRQAVADGSASEDELRDHVRRYFRRPSGTPAPRH
jgi:uncharacterized protein